MCGVNQGQPQQQTLYNQCSTLLMPACDKEDRHIAVLKEDRTDTDMKDKEEVDQHSRRQTVYCLYNTFIYLATYYCLQILAYNNKYSRQ